MASNRGWTAADHILRLQRQAIIATVVGGIFATIAILAAIGNLGAMQFPTTAGGTAYSIGLVGGAIILILAPAAISFLLFRRRSRLLGQVRQLEATHPGA